MRTILVGIDDSEFARKALRFAADLATHTQAKLRVASICRPILISPLVEPELVERIVREEALHAQQLIASACREIEANPLDIEPLVVIGEPAQELAAAAEADDVWMVVVGTHGRGAAGRVLLGSVADRLAHVCSKPVLVVR